MPNPVLIELTRGGLLESAHAGAAALVRATGEVVASLGDIAWPVFPRSAIKPLQALPLIETGAARRFGFGAPEIAIACASHAGTAAHVTLVASMLARAGLTEASLHCGVHEPMDAAAARELVRSGRAATALHHNCSGKHAGMLATAVHLGEPAEGYWRPDHPVQERIRRVLEELTGTPLDAQACGIDGCSVPNWAIPLAGLARAFARLATGDGLDPERARRCAAVAEACWAHPDLVAGPGRLDSLAMQRMPRKVLVKGGAEGVSAGAFPERGLGFALKIADGAKRGADAATAAVIARLYPQAHGLGPSSTLTNWRGLGSGKSAPRRSLRRCWRGSAEAKTAATARWNPL
jgi:L-asparaginase II